MMHGNHRVGAAKNMFGSDGRISRRLYFEFPAQELDVIIAEGESEARARARPG